MFRIEIPYSDDPILDILADAPDQVLGRPFAGYIVLLFGVGDEELATWFSRSLVALDSLTGNDIACVVFARTIKVRAHIDVRESRRPRRSPLKNNVVKLSDVLRGTSHLLVSSGVKYWGATEQEITAVTYATDEIARSIGIIDSLPCALFFDAVPSRRGSFRDALAEGMELLHLSRFRPEELIPFFRAVIHEFYNTKSFRFYAQAIRDIHRLQAAIEASDIAISYARQKIDDMQQEAQRKADSRTRWIKAARESLARGATRHFEQILRTQSVLSQNVVEGFVTRARENHDRLNRLRITARSLRHYASLQEWDTSSRASAEKVMKVYAFPLYGAVYPERITPIACAELAQHLEDLNQQLVYELSSFLPNEAEIEAEELASPAQHIQRLHAEIEHEVRQQAEMKEKLEMAFTVFTSPDRPSISESLRRALLRMSSAPRITALQAKIADALLHLDGGGISSSPLLIVLGDQYNVQQAGSVGPFASSQDLAFYQSGPEEKVK